MSGRLSGFQKGEQQFMEEIINNSSLFRCLWLLLIENKSRLLTVLGGSH